MMILALALLWVISGILFFMHVKEKYNYWYAGYIFTVGLGILCEIIIEKGIPNVNPETYKLIARFLSALSYRLAPYFFLMVGVSVSGFFKGKMKRYIYFWAFIPIIISFIIDFIFPETGFLKVFLDYSPIFWTLVIWTLVYIFLSNFILAYSYFTETNLTLKRQKLFVGIISLPSLYAAVTSYLYPLFFNVHSAAMYNIIPAVIVFISFVFFSFRYGFLGLKITFENERINGTVKAVSSSTQYINHSVKNELLKIKFTTDELRTQMNNEDELKFIDTSIERLMNMLSRIQEQTQEIVLKSDANSLNEIVNAAIVSSNPLLYKKEINIILKLKYHVILVCDRIHLQEVICNIIHNAFDAISEKGEIKFELFQTNKFLILEIKDNGCGISKNDIYHVVDPFYTTKNKQTNFGLGLTYCYNIMKSHGGKLEIQSEKNKETTISLLFPMTKVRKLESIKQE